MRFNKPFFLGLVAFWLPFLIYLKNLYPTISPGDSGELVTAAYSLGVPHPPGYPLFCMLGHLFIKLIPFGNVAYRVNVMSAFLGAMACLILFLIFRKLIKDEIVALVGALIFAFGADFWDEALESEVYTMNIFFVSLLLWLILKWDGTGQKKYLWFFALTAGLNFTVHQTVLMILPVLFLWAYLIFPKKIGIVDVTKMFFLFLAGLLPNCYIYLAALARPVLDWGTPHNFYLFLGHILRWQYEGTTPAKHTLVNYLVQLFVYFKLLSEQWPAVFLTLVGLGFIFQFFKNKLRSLIFIFGFILSSFVLIYFTNYPINNLQIETQRVFYLISYIFVVIWLGFGLEYLMIKVGEIFKVRRSIQLLFLMLLVLSTIIFNSDKNNQSQDYVAYDYAKNILRSCEKNAILWTTGDVQVFSLAYLKLVENCRPDVTIYDHRRIIFGDQYGILVWPVINLIKPPLDYVTKKIDLQTYKLGRPVYYGWFKDPKEMPGYWFCPSGLIYRVYPSGQYFRPPYNYYQIYEKRGLWDERVPKNFLAKEMKTHYERTLLEYILVELGNQYLKEKKYEEAKNQYLQALDVAPEFKPAFAGAFQVAKLTHDRKLEQELKERQALSRDLFKQVNMPWRNLSLQISSLQTK